MAQEIEWKAERIGPIRMKDDDGETYEVFVTQRSSRMRRVDGTWCDWHVVDKAYGFDAAAPASAAQGWPQFVFPMGTPAAHGGRRPR